MSDYVFIGIVNNGANDVPYIDSYSDPSNVLNDKPELLRVCEETLDGKPVSVYYKLRLKYYG